MNTALSLSPAHPTNIARTVFWLTFFSIAMGYLETSVVVYLRKLYYPNGFGFPLVGITQDIAVTEFWREAATIVMLLGAGIMAGRNPMQRFVFFLYCFAVWDIFYYVFLYVLLGWPQSLFTWDILFLIPVPWVGPVLCPVLVSATMILLMCAAVYGQARGNSGRLNYAEKAILLTGCAIILISFMWDYFQYVQLHGEGKTAFSLSSDKELFSEGEGYVPSQFNWLMYGCGQIVLWGGVALYFFRMRKKGK